MQSHSVWKCNLTGRYSITKILQGSLVVFAKYFEMGCPVEHLMNLRPCDYIGIRYVAVERLVKSFHVGVCRLNSTIDLRWCGDVHVPWELGRSGSNGEERETP